MLRKQRNKRKTYSLNNKRNVGNKKKQNNTKGVEAKYKEIYNRMKTLGQDTQELELFYKYLL